MIRFESLNGPEEVGQKVDHSPYQWRTASTKQLAEAFHERIVAQNGINEIPKYVLDGIINYCEAEAFNRLCPDME